jgi:hypothetical protein
MGSCGKGGNGGGNGGGTAGVGGADAGPTGPTDLAVSWTLAGMPADATGCMAHGATQIFVNLSGTIDPALHQSMTVDCAMGSLTFPKLLVEKLGMPYLEGTLLDAKSKTVAITGVDVTPMLGTTAVTLDFFSAMGTGGAGSSSSAASSSHAASSSGTASSSAASSSAGSSSSSSSTGASSSGIADAGSD